jgi:hypothetical protein
VFIQIIQGKCLRRDELRAQVDAWRNELSAGASGWLGTTAGFTDDDTFLAVVRFDSEESAMANSARPEQGEWWAKTEQLFDGPVSFRNSADVTLMLDGGSDDAGFVQVMQGRTDDADRLKSAMRDADPLREARPEIIGSTLALHEDGTFTQTVAFTDEESARSGEQQEMPEEMRQDWDSMIHDLTYYDLRQPWFASPS